MISHMARRLRAEIALVIAALVVGILTLALTAVWSVKTLPIHKGVESVSSTPAIVLTNRYAGPVEESRRLARALLVERNVPGLSVAVAVNGEVVWAESFGWSDVERGTLLTPQTRVRLGALSKPLTAFAVALLHDQGRLDLDAPVQKYVPAYPAKQWPVTTRQLMGDVGGVHRIRGDNNDAMPDAHCERVDEAVAMLADDPLLFQPGTQHRYSIWGWVLVSAVVEGAAGEPFARVMTRRVFEPLAMTRTVVSEDDASDAVTRFHPPRGLWGVRLGPKESTRPDYSCVAGAGAFLSTPTDLVRFGSAASRPSVLKAETISTFQTPTRLASGASTTYALGWTVTSVQLGGQPVRMVSHRGSASGDTVSLLLFPDIGLTVAAAANETNATGVNPFAVQVAEKFKGR